MWGKSLICVPKAKVANFVPFVFAPQIIIWEGGGRPNLRSENKGRQFHSLDFAPKYYVWGGRPNLCSENKGHKFRSFDLAPKYYVWGKA
jgi:hypothetical protein